VFRWTGRPPVDERRGRETRAERDPQGKKRPAEFKSAAGSQNFLNVHKRVKKRINRECKRGRASNRVDNGPNPALQQQSAEV
jgi:hypothetical protein